MPTQPPRLLLKAIPPPPGSSFSVNKIPFQIQPLFPARRTRAMAAAAEPVWHTATLPADTDEAALWDACHQLRSKGLGIAGAGVEFAEPDLVQQWSVDTPARLAAKGFQATAASDACARPAPADTRFPAPSPFVWNWFQDDAHSGLASARAEAEAASGRVSIAHLDCGYRDGHTLLPPGLDPSAARSFVDDDPNPASAIDPYIGGFGNHPGHGTGTIGILAGGHFDGAPYGQPSGPVGGAPFARIVPLRVANSVVLFSNSSIARGLAYAIEQGVDVLSMSMGGVASRLWAELVNQAYEAGIVLVTAAGNNFGPGRLRTPRFIVYPARFRRVLAACGVMADGSPYADFADARKMGGSYGPDSKMDTALAAYTPNTPWAKYACLALPDFDGAGTSSATPQIAAAAACWLRKNLADVRKYPEKWMRVEAVRHALFTSADNRNREYFGRGTLRARHAMAVPVPAASMLNKQPADSVSVPFLGPVWNVLFGAVKPSAALSVEQSMFHVEAAQILGRNGELQRIISDAGLDPDQPAGELPTHVRQAFTDAVMADSRASKALKHAFGGQARRARPTVPVTVDFKPCPAESPALPPPVARNLRVFAFDPILGLRVDTEHINQATLQVRWESDLQPGPIGEYLEVIDVDPSSGACYAPVDLNHPHLLATDGLSPSEGSPQFHQQMVYTVAMTTIQRFEDALGRTALWAPRFLYEDGRVTDSQYVQRLRIYPHALREANAYYSPAKNALLFGYFNAGQENAGDNLPGGLVFTCLSHDVVAHETAHALVDGLHRYYRYQTNGDIAAFHEAFADIVALFQHFSIPSALHHAIATSGGNLRQHNILADLAQQFGQASSGSRALRSALASPPKVTDYAEATEPHDRGAVLLAAVFHAFLEIYDARVSDLKRLATGGTGVLPPGNIPADLVHRLAREASSTAARVLNTCIRALDYCPPVDLTFGEYLRALITADMDLEPEDAFNFRTAFISGFRARGIYPSGVRTFSEDSLRWQPPSFPVEPARIRQMLDRLDLSWDLAHDRRQSYQRGERNGFLLWQWLQQLSPAEGAAIRADLGIYIHAEPGIPKEIPLNAQGVPVLHIHGVRPARRIGSRRQHITDLVVEAVQRYHATDPETGEEVIHRGGCTLLIDMQNSRIRYAIRKRVGHAGRIAAERRFMKMAAESGQPYFDESGGKEPFALLHRSV
jgi:hypothetical protein